MSDVLARLRAEGLELPPYPAGEGNYARAVLRGPFVFVAAHGPVRDGRVAVAGTLGATLTLAEGQEAARLTALNILSTLQAHLGDLDRVEGLCRLHVIVQAADDFREHHLIADAASALMLSALGPERGAHARAAIGACSLPLDMAVNVAATVLARTD